ncbi:MAG: hypothetical protein HXY28_11020 [Hydrogenophilaceae bacterium]|jgi:predicted membrane channel-forming protein YqfA (hemolysin III family)|nr:hypothetical protein [Hydrogenophilaceae bacterium]
MQGVRIVSSLLWPINVWMSFAHLREHAADDYVERTAPIAAAAIAFWMLVGALAALWFANGPARVFWVMLTFLPVIYIIGAWLFAAREEKFSSKS